MPSTLEKPPDKYLHSGGNPATNSRHSLAKHRVRLAILPIGDDDRGNNYTSSILKSFVHRWVDRGSYPVPIVLTHDQDRDRPAVGWLAGFEVTDTHLMGWANLLPQGQSALYGTHGGWSPEVTISPDSGSIDIKALALLGAERPHFKDLNNYSQYYTENYEKPNMTTNLASTETTEEKEYADEQQPEGVDETTNELLDLNDQLVRLVSEKEDEIEGLKAQLAEAVGKTAEYEEKAIDAEVDQMYSELELYGCATCDKAELKSQYVTMAAEVRPNFRNLVVSIAKQGKAKANGITKGAKLLYSEDSEGDATQPRDARLQIARSKTTLRRLSDLAD